MRNSNDQYIDIKALFNLVIKYWYLFAIVLIVSLSAAYAVNKLSVPEYLVESTVLINVNKDTRKVNPNAPIQDYFTMFSSISEIRNEIVFLKSSPLIEKAIDDIDFTISYFERDKFNNYEIYNQSPFIVIYDPTHVQPSNLPIYVELKDETSFRISAEGEEIRGYNYLEKKITKFLPTFKLRGEYHFGEEIKSEDYSFKILLKDNLTISKYVGTTYAFTFNNIQEMVAEYKRRLDVQPIEQESSILNISIRDRNIDKAMDFISALTYEYLEANLDKKNYIAAKTIGYIEDQLNQVKDSLSFVEERLQDYRATHQVMDISVKAGRIYQQLQELENERARLNVQSKYYQSIKEYFESNESVSELLAPSSMGIDDPLLTELIEEFSQKLREKRLIENNNQTKSPHYQTLVNETENLKSTIKENINNIIRTSNIAMEDVNERMRELNYEVNKLPRTERELLGIERNFELNNEIYNYLLKRRAEAQIAKASNLSDYEIIEPAKVLGIASPNKQVNYAVACFIGLMLPGIFVFSKYNTAQSRINTKDELRELTEFPFLGSVIHSNQKKVNVFDQNVSISGSAESYRKIRANLEFFFRGEENKVIIVTSAYANEGKSFNAINIASVLASGGKKTVLIGFDLRKPVLENHFSINAKGNLCSYLINNSNLDDIISSTSIDNLDVIFTGDYPPNPTELINSEKTKKLIHELKDVYSYIVIDTAPIGLVSDSFYLLKYSDINVFITREGYSRKEDIKHTLNEISEKGINGFALVLNDSKVGVGTRGYGYYNYSYLTENKKPSWKKKIKNAVSL